MQKTETPDNVSGTRKNTLTYCAVFFALAFISRWLLANPMLYNIDSVHFAMALDKYDVSLHLPHPPGYFLYVMAGRLARVFTGDANAALTLVGALSSGLLAALAYWAGKDLYGRREGIAAAVITTASPLVWFHGVVGLSYITEAVASLLVAYLCFRMLRGDGRALWISAAALGVFAGFRQGTMMFLLPLWIYSARGRGLKRLFGAASLMLMSALSWFIPTVLVSGGMDKYSSTLSSQVTHAVWGGLNISNSISYAETHLSFISLGMLAALFPLLLAAVHRKDRASGLTAPPAKPAFFILWMLPSLAFYIIVFTQNNAPGYALVYLPGLILLAGRAAVNESERLAGKKPGTIRTKTAVLAALLTLIAAVNSFFFIYSDNPFTLNGIKAQNRRVTAFIDALRDNFSPDDTVLVSSDNFFISFRHAAYYAPEYLVYYVPGISAPTGRYFIKCKDRVSEPASCISPPAGTKRIVHFVKLNAAFPAPAAALGGRPLYADDGGYMIYYDYDTLVNSGIPINEALMAY